MTLAALLDWLALHPHWLGVAVLLLACLECLALVGLLVPGVALLFAVAALAGGSGMGLTDTLLLAWCGALLGDGLSYAGGRLFHQHIRDLPPFRRHPHWLAQAELHFQRYGSASLLIGRFIGPLRPILPLVAGMLDMPLPRFAAVSLLASAGWALVYVIPGWSSGAALRQPLPEHAWMLLAGLLALAALGVAALLRSRRQSPQRRLWLLGGALLLGTALLSAALLLQHWSATQDRSPGDAAPRPAASSEEQQHHQRQQDR